MLKVRQLVSLSVRDSYRKDSYNTIRLPSCIMNILAFFVCLFLLHLICSISSNCASTVLHLISGCEVQSCFNSSRYSLKWHIFTFQCFKLMSLFVPFCFLTVSLPFPQGELLSPCRCSGSVRCTHQPCLIKWISERGSWACELCYYKYQVIAISTKNPLQVS